MTVEVKDVGMGAEQLTEMYASMVRIREFETAVERVFLAGKIPGFLHLYAGEEAVAVGVMAALDPRDYIASTHRGHGHVIARGGDMKPMLAEVYGRATGYCHGKGGSMHIANVELGILGANGIVGASIPLATGAAFASKYRGDDAVAVSFFGDGASNRGTFHEAINLAALWDLPVIYVCENNGFGEFTPQAGHMKVCDIAGRAKGFGIPGVAVDGNDVEAVYAVATEAVGRARRGDGPTLIECKTWRQSVHEVGDPGVERDPEEHKAWLARDPIPRCAQELIARGYAAQPDLERIQEDARREVAEAVEYAENSPFPPVSEAATDVYSN
jgi:TPP-dependent pyruvate/acetoin dehydrogenase alpha subunit